MWFISFMISLFSWYLCCLHFSNRYVSPWAYNNNTSLYFKFVLKDCSTQSIFCDQSSSSPHVSFNCLTRCCCDFWFICTWCDREPSNLSLQSCYHLQLVFINNQWNKYEIVGGIKFVLYWSRQIPGWRYMTDPPIILVSPSLGTWFFHNMLINVLNRETNGNVHGWR